MPYVKTAISIQEPLLQEVDALAHQLNIPRSQLFVMAMEEFIQKRRNRQILEQLNQAYADEPNPTEQTHLTRMKLKHRHIVEEQW